MNAIRSVLFNIFFFAGSLFWSIALIWALLLPEKKCAQIISDIYGGYISLIEKHIMGLTLEIRGWEHLPKNEPYIIAAKHQSAFETLKLPYTKALHYPVIVLKKELTRIPLWGWYPARMGLIAVDRGAGTGALHSLVTGCRKALASGRPVVIFPQGTRVTVGDVKPYKAGIAKIYRDLQVTIVPMALNSGMFWGRKSFFKKPGVVIFEFLPSLPPGMPPLQMMERLEETVEKASNRLAEEARQRGKHDAR